MHRASRQSLLASQWHPQLLAAVRLPKRGTTTGSGQQSGYVDNGRAKVCASNVHVPKCMQHSSRAVFVCTPCTIATSDVLAPLQEAISSGVECSPQRLPKRCLSLDLLVSSMAVDHRSSIVVPHGLHNFTRHCDILNYCLLKG